MKKALLIIDLLQEYFNKGLLADHKQKLTISVNELVDTAHQQNIPVIWVRQEYKADLSDAPLYNKKHNKPITIKGTDGCQLLPELHYIKGNDYEIIKKRYSAFFKTDLNKLLKQLHINTIIIAGVNTMTCVRTTAIDAYQHDYEVILALDCVDSYDVEQHNNSIKYLQYAVACGKHNNEMIKLMQS
ncbi:cysteine hydrolase [Patescibacteria group bacterium]|nr:cysteine hydrolase [Patescibacteria group bacterium]